MTDMIRYCKIETTGFPDSIAYKYLEKVDWFRGEDGEPGYRGAMDKDHPINFDVLRAVVDEHPAEARPGEIYIHVRTGDLHRDFACRNSHDMILSLLQYDTVFRKTAKRFGGSNKVNIVWGVHINGPKIKNNTIKQIEELAGRIADLGYNVSTESTIGPRYGVTRFEQQQVADHDFATLCKASFYMPSYRGFGWLTASLNKNYVNWGMVNVPHFDWVGDPPYEQFISGYKYYLNNSDYVGCPLKALIEMRKPGDI